MNADEKSLFEEFTAKEQELKRSLQKLADGLDACGELEYARFFQGALQRLESSSSRAEKIESGSMIWGVYGGMGSFSDLELPEDVYALSSTLWDLSWIFQETKFRGCQKYLDQRRVFSHASVT